jgi:hypothetical protein
MSEPSRATGVLRISEELSLPLDAVTETFAILAKRRAGKSNAAVVMAEEMYDNGLPWVAIDPKGDWWGVRASGDGKSPGLSVLVFGGLHGDVPLEPTSGKLVADLIIGQRLTAVLDVSEMTKADQRRFLIDFAQHLYKKNAEPLHVFCEEADEYIPQQVRGENATLVGAFETLIKRGGFRGIGITLITQRSASLNKDVLTQIETLIPMRTPSPQDRKAILGWVDTHAAGKDAVDDLPSLGNGEAWVFSPHWLNTLVKIQFRRRRTFDSGSTPKIGGKPRPPATLAEVDLDSIKAAMAETIEKAQADDPKHLRKTIAQLQKDLIVERTRETLQPTVERVEVPTVSPEIVQQLEHHVATLQALGTRLAAELAALGPRPPTKGVPARSAARAPQSSRVLTLKRPTPPVRPANESDVPPARRKLLEALVSLESIGVDAAPRNQLALFAGVSPKSSGYANNLGGLNTSGLITYPSRGLVQITDAGREHVDIVPPPATTEDLHAKIRTLIPDGRWRIIEPLIDAHPGSLSREELAELAGVSPASSGFANNLGALRSLGLLDYPDRGQVAVSDMLFI